LVVKEDADGLPTHLIVDEVIKEDRIHFYQVPRLGSYLAIKLEYNSCLYEDAFDKAVDDYGDVMDKNEGIEKLKKEDEEEDKKLMKEKKERGQVYK